VSQGLRPLRRLSEQIAAREPEDISPVGIDPRHAELKPLIRSLDDLLAKLRHKIESERVFVANAAHELRTPRAVITAQAHVLAKATTEAERVDAERRLDGAIARSSHLIHQLLVLARMEMELHAEPVTLDLAQLVRAELAHFAPVAFARNIEISLEAPDRLMLQWEVHSIQSVVQNLIDNAIRYGRDGGKIVVEVQPLIGAVRLSVIDDGPGIAESDRMRIFDRFYRGTQRDAVSGTGLGLTIVKQAAARMGGGVQLGDGLDGHGCSFTLVIPDAYVQPPPLVAGGVTGVNPKTWIEGLVSTRKKLLLALAVAAAVAVPLGLHLLTGHAASAQTSPSPTAASLRRYIDSLETGTPNYEEMAPLLADSVRERLPQIEAIIHRMGAFQSMVFKGVDGDGMELYDVTFEHGRVEWLIGPLTSDGKVLRRTFRILP
jgi:signal transduction histidine kinase